MFFTVKSITFFCKKLKMEGKDLNFNLPELYGLTNYTFLIDLQK